MAQIAYYKQVYNIQNQSSFLGPPLLGRGWPPWPFPFRFGKGPAPGVPGKLATPPSTTLDPYGDTDRAGGDRIPVAGVDGNGRYAGLGLPWLDPAGACAGNGKYAAGLGLPGFDPVGIPASPRPTIPPLPGVGSGGGALPIRCGVYGVCGVYGDETKAGVDMGVLL